MEEFKEKKEGIFSRLKKIKHIEIIIAIIAVIIMLGIYFSSFLGGGAKSAPTQESAVKETFYSDYCARMKSEITQMVNKMDGAGNASVVINWESSVELLLAQTINNSTNSSASSPVIINSQPIVLKEIYPKALGVVIVCDGGNDARIKVNITMSIATLLNIVPDKIIVYGTSKK